MYVINVSLVKYVLKQCILKHALYLNKQLY